MMMMMAMMMAVAASSASVRRDGVVSAVKPSRQRDHQRQYCQQMPRSC